MQQRVFAVALALACACSASLLPGCATQPAASAAVPVERPARASIDAFTLDGRIAVQQGERRNAANISWRHAADRDEMLFATPLGQGLAELTRDAGGGHLRLADRREFAAADWDSLAAQVLGAPLPLSALPRWVLGAIPPRHAGDMTRDEQGRPRQVRSDGWRIDYLDYESPAATALPTLIELHRDDDGIEVRLKVDDWQLNP